MTTAEREQLDREYNAPRIFLAGQFYADRLGYLRCAECAAARYIETGEKMYDHKTGFDVCDFCGEQEQA